MKDKLRVLFESNDIKIDNDIFDYGYNVLTNYFIFIAFLFPLSILFDVILESVLFVVFYTPLKKYIGGFHFDSPKLCTTFSIFTTLIMALLIKYLKIESLSFIILSIFVLFFLSFRTGTADHPNKRLTIKEKKYFTKKALMIEGIYLTTVIIFFKLNALILVKSIFLSIVFSVLGAILANFINKFN